VDVIIVGAGIMGLSTAWACHRRGHAVRVYEQGPVPNPLASSVDEHRAIREIYGTEAGYTAMVGPAFAAWDALWEDLGERLYVETGVLALDTGPDSWAHGSIATLDDAGIAYERWMPSEVGTRLPFLALDGIVQGLFFHRGGILLAGRILELLAHRLGTGGAGLHAHRPVAAVDLDRAQVTLADGEQDAADRVVVTAGPWVARLLPALAARVTPSRQVLAYLAPPADLADAWAAAPILVDIRPDEGFYLLPPAAGTAMKVGDHRFSLRGHADLDRDAGTDETRTVYELCRTRLAGFEGYRMTHGRTCFYTATEDERFIVEPAGAKGLVLTGFSGHGFKFGPLIGLGLAAALAGEHELAALTRWAAGQGDSGPA
jgi:glycine/D-amino acid oxidase-like deaminating enzyme